MFLGPPSMPEGPISTGEEPAKDTRFKPGNNANPKGRPKGSRNALGEDFLKALHEDFQAKGVEAIQSMRVDKPAEYVKVIASILPKELNVKIDPIEELTDDELINRLHALRAAYNAVAGGAGQVGNGAQQTLEHAEITALPALH